MITVFTVLLLFLTALCIVFGWITFKKYKALQQMKSTRIAIARDLHDEIGATLSSISFYSEACKINIVNKNNENSIQLIDKIGATSRNTINSMNDIVWMINPKNDILNRLFERIDNFGKELFVSRGISFYFYSDPQLNNLLLPIEHRKNLYLIIKEALNNSAKYASCSQIELLIQSIGNQIKVIVKDNGIGFDSSSSNEGNGLLNMRVRAAEMGSKLLVETTVGKGTVLSFSLPYPPKW